MNRRHFFRFLAAAPVAIAAAPVLAAWVGAAPKRAMTLRELRAAAEMDGAWFRPRHTVVPVRWVHCDNGGEVA